MFLVCTINAKPWYNQIVKTEIAQEKALEAYVLPEIVEQLYPFLLISPPGDLTVVGEGWG